VSEAVKVKKPNRLVQPDRVTAQPLQFHQGRASCLYQTRRSGFIGWSGFGDRRMKSALEFLVTDHPAL